MGWKFAEDFWRSKATQWCLGIVVSALSAGLAGGMPWEHVFWTTALAGGLVALRDTIQKGHEAAERYRSELVGQAFASVVSSVRPSVYGVGSDADEVHVPSVGSGLLDAEDGDGEDPSE